MADMTAPIVLLSEQQQQWLDSATENHWLRRIDFQEISHLQMGVASGGFGIVHAGKWRGMPVAIKVLFSLADFIQEVRKSLLPFHSLSAQFPLPPFLCDVVFFWKRRPSLESHCQQQQSVQKKTLDLHKTDTHTHARTFMNKTRTQRICCTKVGSGIFIESGTTARVGRTMFAL